MAISRAILYSYEDLITWANANLVPTYFSEVSLDLTDNSVINFITSDGYKLLSIRKTGSNAKYNDFIIYNDNGESVTAFTNSTTANQPYGQYCSICNNGVIMRFSNITQGNDSNNTSTGYGVSILITKNNHNKIMIICGTGGGSSATLGNSLRADVHCISEDDSLSIESKLTFTPRQEMQQMQLVPFVSSRLSNDVVYTQNAFYIATGNMYASNYFAFELNGVKYMSNGYWAVKDE